MPINFTQIIRDSWHFVQNEKRIVMLLSVLVFAANVFITVSGNRLVPDEVLRAVMNGDGAVQAIPIDLVSNAAAFLMIKVLINAFVSAWCAVIIHQISQRRFHALSQTLAVTLKRIVGVIAISVVIFLPLMIGIAESVAAIQQKVQPSVISLIIMIIGISFYVRLFLSPLHYLLTDASVTGSMKAVLRAGSGRVSTLFILCLLIYMVLPMGEAFLLSFSVNTLMAIVTGAVGAFINVFALIVTYRFYTLFIAKG